MVSANYKEDYLGILDGIRGLMAFWVFFYHLQMACIGKSTPWGGGAIAVDIFMLLSGFLMAYHWHIRKDRFNKFKYQAVDFYIRRFFRIAPLYYILLTVAFIGQERLFEMSDFITNMVPPPWATKTQEVVIITHERVSAVNVLTHYLFLFGFIPKYANSNILPDWSIGLEMQFYLIFPFLILSISRLGAFSVILILVIVSFITNKLFGLYLSTGIFGNFPQPAFILFKINIFAAGMSIAFIYLNRNNIRALPWAILAILSLYNVASQVWIMALLLVFMLVFNDENKEIFGKLMSNKIAKFFGDTSYSVYLVHTIIYTPILYGLFKNEWFMSLSVYFRLLGAFILTAIPIYIVSYFLYRLVEVRGIQLGRYILLKIKLTNA
ncbi:MAG: acyltransferase [Methylococcaceae bacterium]